ncbi:MAG: metallophosphoesterase [Planctomycetota bacterium]|nr:metallophosphoesterase [Planctomycetota bacterium]
MQSSDDSKTISRRNLLSATAGISVAGLIGATDATAAPPIAAGQSKPANRVLRIAHLTDVHVQPELRATAGMTACLRHVQAQADPVDLILFGGDCIMDALSQTLERTKTQWDLWQAVLKAECSLPWKACIGNHDIWGWKKATLPAVRNNPLFGKQWALEPLKLDKRYYGFERAGWKFIVLDSTHAAIHFRAYQAKLDDEQLDWLAKELAATPATTPVLVLSHIPILSVSAFLDGDNAKGSDWNVPGAWMHLDAAKLTALFHKHGNVKVCLSGHMHMVDTAQYLGTRYYCNGAVCGGFWEGKYHQFDEGYALVNLYDNGDSQCEYVNYGWKAEAAAG